MAGLMIVVAALLVIVIVDILAQTHGVDSRPDSQDPRAPVRGISV